MKNITVSVPDEVYRRARITAAEKGTSVSALVGEYLASLAVDDAEFRRLEALQNEVLSRIKHFDASKRLSRDELYERAVR